MVSPPDSDSERTDTSAAATVTSVASAKGAGQTVTAPPGSAVVPPAVPSADTSKSDVAAALLSGGAVCVSIGKGVSLAPTPDAQFGGADPWAAAAAKMNYPHLGSAVPGARETSVTTETRAVSSGAAAEVAPRVPVHAGAHPSPEWDPWLAPAPVRPPGSWQAGGAAVAAVTASASSQPVPVDRALPPSTSGGHLNDSLRPALAPSVVAGKCVGSRQESASSRPASGRGPNRWEERARVRATGGGRWSRPPARNVADGAGGGQ